MGYHVVSVTLKSGKHFDQVVTSEGCVIQVRGHREVPFTPGRSGERGCEPQAVEFPRSDALAPQSSR